MAAKGALRLFSEAVRSWRTCGQPPLSINCRPNSNRRRHRNTAPPHENCAESPPEQYLPNCACDCFQLARGEETRDHDPPTPGHSPPPTWKEIHLSRRAAALKQVDLREPSIEVRKTPTAARAATMREEPTRGEPTRAEPMHARKGWARSPAEPARCREWPMVTETATGPRSRPKEMVREQGVLAAHPSSRWTVARLCHGRTNSARRPLCPRRN